MITETYSPKNVNITVGGVALEGWESLSISRAAGNTTQQKSADGKMTGITYSSDDSGTAEITVQQQNSAVNAFMSALQAAQDLKADVLRFDMVVNDPSGSVLAILKGTFLDAPADMDLGAEQTDRTWGLYVEKLVYTPKPVGIDKDGLAASAATAATAALATIEGLGYNK